MGYRAHFATEYKVKWSSTADFNFMREEFETYMSENNIECIICDQEGHTMSLPKKDVQAYLNENKAYKTAEGESDCVSGICHRDAYNFLEIALRDSEPSLDTIEIYWF